MPPQRPRPQVEASRAFATFDLDNADCITAWAQERKRLGVLMSRVATEPWQSLLTIFMQGIRKLGWIEGQNLETKVRWSAGDQSLIQAYATDFVD